MKRILTGILAVAIILLLSGVMFAQEPQQEPQTQTKPEVDNPKPKADSSDKLLIEFYYQDVKSLDFISKIKQTRFANFLDFKSFDTTKDFEAKKRIQKILDLQPNIDIICSVSGKAIVGSINITQYFEQMVLHVVNPKIVVNPFDDKKHIKDNESQIEQLVEDLANAEDIGDKILIIIILIIFSIVPKSKLKDLLGYLYKARKEQKEKIKKALKNYEEKTK